MTGGFTVLAIKFLVGPFSLVVFMLAVVLFKDKNKKDLFILFSMGTLMLKALAGL